MGKTLNEFVFMFVSLSVNMAHAGTPLITIFDVRTKRQQISFDSCLRLELSRERTFTQRTDDMRFFPLVMPP